MDPAVRQYDFTSPPISLSWGKKVGMFFVIVCFTFGLRWAGDYMLHWPHESLIQSLFMPVVVGALFVFRPLNHWIPQGNSSVIIGQDFVEGRTRSSRFTFKKRIGRKQVKSIFENRRGLYVMDRGKFAARMLGLVFIPATLPEYQEIKSILSGWAPVQAQR
jgi:hypothetical protein